MRWLTWALLVGAFLRLATRRGAAVTVTRDLWPNLLLTAAAALSALWSVAPPATSWAAHSLAASSAFAVYVAARFSRSEQLELLQQALLLVALYTIAAALVSVPGAWAAHGLQGWFTSKNHLGRCMSLAIVVSAVVAGDPRRRGISIATGVVCAFALAASDSRTAMVVTTACVTGWLILTVAQRAPTMRRAILAISATSGAVVAVIVARYADAVLEMIGRDTTLSSRTVLWHLVLDEWRERPWLGYGYAAFWRGMTSPGGRVATVLHYYPWHAHNGFLDLALDLGAVGVVAFGVLLVLYIRRAIAIVMRGSNIWAIWPTVYLGHFVLSNLTESELLRHDSIYWPLYLIAVAQLASLGREASARTADNAGAATKGRHQPSVASGRRRSAHG